MYALRVNLSVAIVAMVKPSNNSEIEHFCNTTSSSNDDGDTESGGEFDWTETEQGLILGAFYYGYIVTQIPGGFLAERYGGKLLFGIGILMTAILTLLTPVAARAGKDVFIVLRVLEGIFEVKSVFS